MPNMPPPGDPRTPACSVHTTFEPTLQVPPALHLSRPRVAILREQGVNSHVEMAYAFTEAGFDAYDVHMTDLQTGRTRLADFQGMVACGGFSYGDTLGAGIGWARSITFNPALAEAFEGLLRAARTPSAWACATAARCSPNWPDIIPGAQDWPRFTTNRSERFEARLSLVEVLESPSPVLPGHGRQPRAHRRGARRGLRQLPAARRRPMRHRRAALRRQHRQADRGLPANPNGSPGGLTA
jgi:phosphoribosylformylglycinamidine synthase